MELMTFRQSVVRKGRAAYALFSTLFVLLQGCAVVPVLPMAYGLFAAEIAWLGYSAVKIYQFSTGGSAEVRFKEEQITPSDRDTLTSIKRLAILPGTPRNVRIAEELIRRTSYHEIVTPAQVLATIQTDPRKASLGADESHLTEDEIVRQLKELTEKLSADAVLVYREVSGGFDTSFLSLKRSETTANFTLKIFSAQKNRFVWNQSGQVAMKFGSSLPPQDEVDKLVATSTVDKVLEALGKH